MKDTFIVGLGQTPVGEHWHLGLRDLGARAIRSALADAGVDRVDALFVGNMMSGQLSGQENLGTLLADAADLLPIEAYKVEAACASGAAAVRMATIAVASGAFDTVLAVGIEKMTDVAPDHVTGALATAADQDWESSFGLSFTALNALLMRRYMHETCQPREAFAPFAVLAHQNAATNPNAMFREPITAEEFAKSSQVSSPICILDAAPVCDGAAAVVVCNRAAARSGQKPVRIAGSAGTTDTIALAGRESFLRLECAARSAELAYREAKLTPKDMDLFEAHDAFTIMSALSLEACGFAPQGQAVRLAQEGAFGPKGELPISTFGGLKARGHPVGASGAYQIVEAALQLRGEAGANQVPRAKRAMTQSIGGHGSVIVTHILEG